MTSLEFEGPLSPPSWKDSDPRGTEVIMTCAPCVARLSSLPDRLGALRAAVIEESEPVVTVTHLLHLCRDEHRVLWERAGDPGSRHRVANALSTLADLLPATTTAPSILDGPLRAALAAALEPVDDVPTVVMAHALAEFLDDRFCHSFAESFRRRSPYQPGVGDPFPLDSPDLRTVMASRSTSPPWRLANRLDETRHIRLAGEWAVQFQVVFDYSLVDKLAGLITADTVIATCHPNRSLRELDLTRGTDHRTFPVVPVDADRQRSEINMLITCATAAGASIVVLPELCVTESLAVELQDWVRRPVGPRLLIAGSYHHENRDQDGSKPIRRRNTAIGWVRGYDPPLTHDKHSPADRPIVEDIQPQGWPELRVYVTADGWHLVIAICRDLLNPHAVHALTEVGANLVLVPAMSETLMAFGGPVAHLVGASQALVAIANNPREWADSRDPVAHRPACALFGHPALGQQTRLVQVPDPGPGVALLTVHSAEIAWLPAIPADARSGPDHSQDVDAPAEPAWLRILVAATRDPRPPAQYQHGPISLTPAAVLVLLTDGPTGPRVLLSERAADLADYPGRLVFPGGEIESFDAGPVEAALREAREEVGLDPACVELIGLLPAFALPDSGFLVHPVVAWSAQPAITASINFAEVASLCEIPLRELSLHPCHTQAQLEDSEAGIPSLDLTALGPMTATVIDLLLVALARGEDPVHLADSSEVPNPAPAVTTDAAP
jgi:8-oxo-dGTP pyrophosphatase MutT (NUDIX family)